MGTPRRSRASLAAIEYGLMREKGTWPGVSATRLTRTARRSDVRAEDDPTNRQSGAHSRGIYVDRYIMSLWIVRASMYAVLVGTLVVALWCGR